MMKLYHDTVYLGEVTVQCEDGAWLVGEISLTPAANEYWPLFRFLTDEPNGDKDPEFPEDWLNANNWYLLDEAGGRQGIEIPGVYPDNLITWRWR